MIIFRMIKSQKQYRNRDEKYFMRILPVKVYAAFSVEVLDTVSNNSSLNSFGLSIPLIIVGRLFPVNTEIFLAPNILCKKPCFI